jgi:hypothetical protein
VPPITIVTGLILIAVGLAGYLPHQTSLTALIPAAFGVLLVVLGVLARQEKMRMHAMHGAAVVGLIGLIGGILRIVQTLASGEIRLPLAFSMTILMTLVCLVFLGLCVRSFIMARRRRKEQGT